MGVEEGWRGQSSSYSSKAHFAVDAAIEHGQGAIGRIAFTELSASEGTGQEDHEPLACLTTYIMAVWAVNCDNIELMRFVQRFYKASSPGTTPICNRSTR